MYGRSCCVRTNKHSGSHISHEKWQAKQTGNDPPQSPATTIRTKSDAMPRELLLDGLNLLQNYNWVFAAMLRTQSRSNRGAFNSVLWSGNGQGDYRGFRTLLAPIDHAKTFFNTRSVRENASPLSPIRVSINIARSSFSDGPANDAPATRSPTDPRLNQFSWSSSIGSWMAGHHEVCGGRCLGAVSRGVLHGLLESPECVPPAAIRPKPIAAFGKRRDSCPQWQTR